MKNQAGAMWACDFNVVYDRLFRTWYIFVVLELKRRRILHTSITKFPTDAWTGQQLREATSWGSGPQYLIHDRDSKYAAHFSAVATGSDMQELKTPYRALQVNGIHERLMDSLRQEYLDLMLIHNGRHLQWVVQEYTTYYNRERPHQDIDQRIPTHYDLQKSKPASGRIVSKSILGGLHRSYACATYLH